MNGTRNVDKMPWML